MQSGLATWYGARLAGHRMANGDRFDPNAMTAAHRTLPFGTLVEVCLRDSRRCVRVRITDRGPWGDSRRVIDLSRAAASELGITKLGLANVVLRVASLPDE